MSDNKMNWWVIIAVVVVVAIVSSLLIISLTGNIISVAKGTAAKVYTTSEIDTKINSLNSQISALNSKVGSCCTVNQTQTGILSVTSSPSSASLYVDNVYKGLTPYTVSSLSVGNHAVKITKSGYNTYSTTKYINVGNNSLNAVLTLVQTNQTNQTNISG